MIFWNKLISDFHSHFEIVLFLIQAVYFNENGKSSYTFLAVFDTCYVVHFGI
jgi:hypothetical protein